MHWLLSIKTLRMKLNLHGASANPGHMQLHVTPSAALSNATPLN